MYKNLNNQSQGADNCAEQEITYGQIDNQYVVDLENKTDPDRLAQINGVFCPVLLLVQNFGLIQIFLELSTDFFGLDKNNIFLYIIFLLAQSKTIHNFEPSKTILDRQKNRALMFCYRDYTIRIM